MQLYIYDMAFLQKSLQKSIVLKKIVNSSESLAIFRKRMYRKCLNGL